MLLLLICVNSPWGVVSVWPWWENPKNWRKVYCQELDSAKSAGLTWIRPNCIPHCEFRFNIWDFRGQDSIVKFANERNIEILFILTPRYWRKDSSAWQVFWERQVERYDGDGYQDALNLTKPIKHWEICNEPDGDGRIYAPWQGPIHRFCEYSRVTYRAIKKADNESKVYSPTIMADYNMWWNYRNRIRDSIIIEPGPKLDTILHYIKDFVDGVTIHYYTYDFPALEEKIKPVIEKYNKPLWLTEIGWYTIKQERWGQLHPVTEEEQAIRIYNLCKFVYEKDWLTGVSFFTLRDDTLRYGAWGLLRQDFSPKPAFDTVRNFIRTHP